MYETVKNTDKSTAARASLDPTGERETIDTIGYEGEPTRKKTVYFFDTVYRTTGIIVLATLVLPSLA